MTDAQYEELMILLYDFYDLVDVYFNELNSDVHNWIGLIGISLVVLIGIKCLTWLVRW